MLEAAPLRPSRNMARSGPVEPFLASTVPNTDFSSLLKGCAGAWVGRSSGNTTAPGSSGNNPGSSATLTQETSRSRPSNGSVVKIVVANAGSGYSRDAVLNISPPLSFGVVNPNATNPDRHP